MTSAVENRVQSAPIAIEASHPSERPEPMPDNIRSIQPGGGMIQSLELIWGRWRRRFLHLFYPDYVQLMQSRLKGDPNSVPVEVIDSRDIKLFKNVARCWFEPRDDLFLWRDTLPVARAGLAELMVFGGGLTLASVVLALTVAWWASLPTLLLAVFVVSFFRDPERITPGDSATVVSPADGKVVDIAEVERPEFVGEPAVKIGIFLSVFNVHVNRVSLAGRLLKLEYLPGKFLNALRSVSADENERLTLSFVELGETRRRFQVVQIAGAIARRIVCEIRPGQELARGQRFGMIKFGSRTELILPRKGLELSVRLGQKVKGGKSVLGRYVAGSSAG